MKLEPIEKFMGSIPFDASEIYSNCNCLKITLRMNKGNDYKILFIGESCLYRVLENDYFPSIMSSPDYDENFYVYRVKSGGWYEEEIRKSGLMREHFHQENEYLVVTENACISILSDLEPSFI